MINPDSWAAQHNGPYLKSPHGIEGQCVSVSSQWSFDNGWGELMGDTAYDIWLAGNPHFDKIPSYPKAGDIAFFGPGWGEGAGHTGLVVNGPVGVVSIFQQDDPDGSAAHTKQYGINQPIGYFRPKETNQGDDMFDGASAEDWHRRAVQYQIKTITGLWHSDDDINRNHKGKTEQQINDEFFGSVEYGNQLNDLWKIAYGNGITDADLAAKRAARVTYEQLAVELLASKKKG